MLAAAERWGAGEDERPYLPRAFSYARFLDGEAHFLLEDVGPGTRRLCELRAGEGLWTARAAGHRLHAPRGRPSCAARGRGGGDRPARHPADRLDGAATVLLGFRDRRPRRGRRPLDDAARRHAAPPATTGSPRRRLQAITASSPTCSPPSSTATPTPPSTPAAHPDARGGQGAVRGALGPRTACLGVGHGVRFRRLLRLRRAHARGLMPRVRGRSGDRRRAARAGGGARGRCLPGRGVVYSRLGVTRARAYKPERARGGCL